MTSPELTLAKLHGVGNDFLVSLDPPAGFEADGTALARRLCDRHRGIGADGLIAGRRLDGTAGAALSFRLWNADGSEAEMSGNGIRCLVHEALEQGWVREGEPLGVDTPAGVREVTISRKGEGIAWGSVDMGVVKVQGEADRCNVGEGQLLVDVGNPHLVVLGPDPATIDVQSLGPMLEKSDPAGLNVEFVALGPGAGEVTMRVWERGVGETEACGTGSCAAAAALRHWGRVGTAVTVHQPGGVAAVELRADGSAVLSGPSERIATCTVRV
ncbi:MAG TPA: diaminopimelate epimerase [Acidimicrobiales bacterium]|nr:diaminopimelate epimerase [Acidimicrobiales bacterium]